MNFNKILKSLFGDKSSRDMKLIQPLVEKVKQAYPDIAKLSNDELRAKSKEIRDYVQGAAKPYQEKIAELKAKIEETPIDEREPIFNEIDKQDKEMLDALENALNEVMPVAFSIVKDTARRFSENEETVVTATDFDRELAANPANDFITIDGDKAIYHNEWTAGGNKIKWNMVHYDVQLFGGIALHQGKIAEMATGEGKTLVCTWSPSTTIWLSVTLSGWDPSMSSMDFRSTVSTSISPTPPHAAKLIRPTSLSVPTTSLDSIIFATIWLSHQAIWYSDATTSPSSMR